MHDDAPQIPPSELTASSGTAATVDPRLFRKVMGSFATGVTVVSLDAGGAPRGMTASAFMSGSLEPPLCVICVGKGAHTHAFLSKTARFGVNMLGQEQEAYARHFAGRPVAGLAPAFEAIHGVPMLADAIARIVAELAACHDCGDHTLFVGRILYLDGTERMPLIYHRGGFGTLELGRGKEEVAAPEFW